MGGGPAGGDPAAGVVGGGAPLRREETRWPSTYPMYVCKGGTQRERSQSRTYVCSIGTSA